LAIFGFFKPDIARLAAKRDVDRIIAALAHSDPIVRHHAADALGDIGDTRAVEPLCAALKDEGHVAVAATMALGKLGDARAVGSLCVALNNSYDYVAIEAAQALGVIGDARAVEPLCAALNAPYQVCNAAARALGAIGDARAVEPLCVALNRGDFRQVAEALVVIGDVRAVGAFLGALRDREKAVFAAPMLDRLGWQPDTSPDGVAYWITRRDWQKCAEIGTAAVGTMREILGGDRVPLGAIEALATIGGAQAVETLIEMRRGNSRDAAEALVRIGADAVAPLCAALQVNDRDESFEQFAVDVLARLGDARAVIPLTNIVVSRYEHSRVVLDATTGLQRIGRPALEPLCAALTSGERKTRAAAAKALDSLKWVPDHSEAAGAYWAVKRDWQKCVEVGPAAIRPLLVVIQEAHGVRNYVSSFADTSLTEFDDNLKKLEDRDSAQAALNQLRAAGTA
jgi:HEAT repeat protein